MIAPDEAPTVERNDLDAADSGRDESGVMRRSVVRFGVQTWAMNYTRLSDEDMAYMLALLDGKSQFLFTHPVIGESDKTTQTMAYCSKQSASWQNSVTRDWYNVKFNIIEC